MVFDDDHIRLHVEVGYTVLNCREYGISWPPPERFIFEGFVFKRKRYSTITDEQRKNMSHVCRSAEYFVDPDQSEVPVPALLC